jgi:hypothetical protein
LPQALKDTADFFRPTLSLIDQEGQAGAHLAELIRRAQDAGEVAAGKRLARLDDIGIAKLWRKDRFHVVDVLEGRAEPRSDAIRRVVDGIRTRQDTVASEAEELGVVVKETIRVMPGDPRPLTLTAQQHRALDSGQSVRTKIRRPFRRLPNYFPHVIRSAGEMKRGQLRRDIIENLERIGVAPDADAAEALLDSYIRFIERGGREHLLIRYLMQTGLAHSSLQPSSTRR